jgi:twinkle protein
MKTKEPCPKCREEGHDRAGDNLTRWPEGNAYCIRCGYKEYKGHKGEAMSESKTYSKLTADMVRAFPLLEGNPTRCISSKVTKKFGLRATYDEESGELSEIYYPYRTEYKRRRLPKDFITTGSLPCLFGQDIAMEEKKSMLLITEGEEDCLAGYAMVGDKVNVVGIPSANDKGELDKVIPEQMDFYEQYEKVFICLDNDKVGQRYAEQIARYMIKLTVPVIVKLDPVYGKDLSDFWVGGYKDKFFNAVGKSEMYTPPGIVKGSEIDLTTLSTPRAPGVPVPFPGLQEKIHGIRKAELLLVCAASGIGKTTISREISKALIDGGHSVAQVELESDVKTTAQALVALDMDIPLHKFMFSPPPAEEIEPHRLKMIDNGRTYLFGGFNDMDDESLIPTLYSYAKSSKVDFIVLDHIHACLAKSMQENERRTIDRLMSELADMAVETNVGLIVISHIKRTNGDKSYAHGGEVELTDLRGSAALEQYSWTVVGVERDQQGDDHNFCRVRVLKNRTFGFTGLADTLYYNPLTGRMKSVPKEELPDLEEISDVLEKEKTVSS